MMATSPLDRATPPAAGALRPFDFPDVVRHTLSNGVRVLVAPIHSFPVVSVGVILEAGATQDAEPLLGTAALVASLLESGTAARSAADIAAEVESLGVQLDAVAGWDTAHAGVTALRSRLEPGLDVLADIVLNSQFPQPEVERLRAERIAEILQRRTDPQALAGEAVARFIFAPESRLARPLGGTAASVERITRPDLQRFHAEHFSAQAASMVVVGDIEPETAIGLLDARFGAWPGGVHARAHHEVRPRTEEPQVVVVHRPGAVQSEIRVGHLGASRSTDDYFPLLIMNAILGGMFTSRLNLNLRERHGYTYGASSAFAMRREPGSFAVGTAVQTEVTAAAVREILGELGRIRDATVSDAELEDARNFFAGVFPLRLQTADAIANRLTELLVYDLPPDYFDTYRDRVLAVTADDVLQAAQRHVRPDHAAVVVVGDADAIRDGLETLGIAPVRVVEPAELQEL
jgi:zinc protease